MLPRHSVGPCLQVMPLSFSMLLLWDRGECQNDGTKVGDT